MVSEHEGWGECSVAWFTERQEDPGRGSERQWRGSALPTFLADLLTAAYYHGSFLGFRALTRSAPCGISHVVVRMSFTMRDRDYLCGLCSAESAQWGQSPSSIGTLQIRCEGPACTSSDDHAVGFSSLNWRDRDSRRWVSLSVQSSQAQTASYRPSPYTRRPTQSSLPSIGSTPNATNAMRFP